MKTYDIGGKKFSQLSLGTVQLGMNYGIANDDGQPSLDESFAVLNTAINGGITALDTAAGYGVSEDVIGKFLKQRGKADDLFITTKFMLKLPEDAKPEQVRDGVRKSLESSLTKLGLDRVDCLMLHRANDFTMFKDVMAKTLEDLIAEKLIGRAGVSYYLPHDLDVALNYDVVKMVQGPMSMFDHAVAESGLLEKFKQKGIAAIARSVFLQGLFFLDPEKLTDENLIEAAKDKLTLIRSIAQEENMSVAQMAVAYIRDMDGMTGIVLGSEKAVQVEQNLKLFADDAPVLSEKCRKLIDDNCSADIQKIMITLSRGK